MSNERALEADREFQFNEADFCFIKKRVYEVAGIALSERKRQLVYSRLARRLRALGLQRFEQYCALLKVDGDPDELCYFINALTTNLTHFFRESHHFDYLYETIFAQLVQRNAARKRIRIWSAGCSTGEEAYSIAACASEAIEQYRLSSWDIKILATDLDTNVLQTARDALYREERVEPIPKALRNKYFSKPDAQSMVSVSPKLKQLITFKQLNLMEKWPMKGSFDVIFCRNVIIYFDKPTQQMLFKRFHQVLSDSGYLMLGHSETLGTMQSVFMTHGRTIFQKK